MLPFLEPKKMAGIVMMKMKGNSPEASHEEGEHSPELMAAAEDLISAVHSKSASDVASALQCAMAVCANKESME